MESQVPKSRSRSQGLEMDIGLENSLEAVLVRV